VSVPGQVEISITMKMDNWGFGEVEGHPRGENPGTSARPLGTEKPSSP